MEASTGFKERTEDRARVRKRISLEVDAVIGERVIQSETCNISATGLFIKTGVRFQPGETARVVFALPNHRGARPVKLRARTVWNNDRGVSVQFVGVSQYFTDFLDDVVQELPDHKR